MSGIVETMELFCLLYDGYNGVFHLSLCYGGGKTMTLSYDRLEFCDASKDVDGGVWDVGQVTEEIINDLEGAVPAMLRKG